mmetsp:Transcript_57796/g.164208  ORF Transcript_57796/g.164208 Transcript_57796/m.164208 type:complete len:262 (-) Transcript_57796:936-1721(-)
MRLLEFLLVILGLHAQLLAHVLRSHGPDLPVNLDVNDGDEREGLHPLRLDPKVIPLAGLHHVHESRIVVGGVAGHTGDDARALVHLDRQQGQHVHDVVLAGRRPHLGAQEVLSGDLLQAHGLAPRHQDVLEAHVPRGAVRADVNLVTLARVAAVDALGQDPAVGLAGHRLGPQRGGQSEDPLALQRLERWRQLQELHLDGRILLRRHALALRPVVVHAGLAVRLAVDRRPLAEADLVLRLQLAELPAHKGVVVRVHRGRDE